MWKNGKKNGPFIETKPDGTSFEVEFNDGQKIDKNDKNN